MAKKIDWVKKDEEARKAYIAETGKYISYGNFRQFHPELVPSMNKPPTEKGSVGGRSETLNSKNSCICKKLTMEDADDIKRELQNGTTKRTIAKRYGVDARTLNNFLSVVGVVCKERESRRWESEEFSTLRKMVAAGASDRRIASTLDRTEKAVLSMRKKLSL